MLVLLRNNSGTDACQAACTIWDNVSHCTQPAFTFSDCLKECHAIDNPHGWGWNYVECLHDLCFGPNNNASSSSHNNNKTVDCWKLPVLCRDIFHSGQLDQYGNGTFSSQPKGVPTGYILAVFCAMVAVLYFGAAISGWFDHSAPERPLSDPPQVHYVPLNNNDQEEAGETMPSSGNVEGMD